MFISSYNTYISTNSSERTATTKLQKSKEQVASFISHLTQDEVLESKNSNELPLDYISNYKVFSNKQKLQDQELYKDKVEYEKGKKILNVKTA